MVTAGLTAALGFSALLAPATASASCADRKTTGTVGGAVGGAVIGHAIAGGPAAIILGAAGGALAGRAIAGSTCGNERRAEYRRRHHIYGPYPGAPGYGPYAEEGPPPPPAYYDQRGNLVGAPPPAAAPPPPGPGPAAYASGYGPAPAGGACRTETLSYYDDRGELVQRPVQDCGQ
jgi:osmotically inducible lipoprotein OsmB